MISDLKIFFSQVSNKMESYIAGGVDSILLDELSFKPSPGASYILNKTQVRFYPSGSSIYSPGSGQRVCKINSTGPSNIGAEPIVD